MTLQGILTTGTHEQTHSHTQTCIYIKWYLNLQSCVHLDNVIIVASQYLGIQNHITMLYMLR